MPRTLVLAAASVGAGLLLVLCVASAVCWANADPFLDAAVRTCWTYLCWTCFALALAWPVLLVVTILGYARYRPSAGPARPTSS